MSTESCNVEPFRYQSVPQPLADTGATSNQINEQQLEAWLIRNNEAICTDLTSIVARLVALETVKATRLFAAGTDVGSIENLTRNLTWATPSPFNGDVTVSGANITFDTAGDYQIDVVARAITTNNRFQLIVQGQLDTGSGYADVTPWIADNYAARDSSFDTGCVVLPLLISANVGDRVRFNATANAVGNAVLLAAGTSLRIVGFLP